MIFASRRTILGATLMTMVGLGGGLLAGGQVGAPPPQKPPLAEEVFKNVQVLKGLPVDEFMGTMGIFSAALGMSCEDCHAASDTTWENYALDNPKKMTARRMVQMMAAINKTNFGGRQVVTCYSCHRGADRPRLTPSLTLLYGTTPGDEPDDVVTPSPRAPAVDQVLDKYLQAIGGTQRLAKLTSFVAKGTSVGYGPEGDKRQVEVFVKAPGQRTVIIHTLDGDSTTTYNGRDGWIAAPHRPVPVLTLSGGDLAGAKLDAELSFPGQIKQVLGQWRVGFPATIDDRRVEVVQGTSTAGVLTTLYFDEQTGLLTRLVRYANSRVGRMPTQYDYADYREVAGVKMPFRWTMTWLGGRDSVELTDVQVNAAIDATKFAKPAPPVAK